MIPLFKPSFGDEELKALRELSHTGLVGPGPKSLSDQDRFQAWVAAGVFLKPWQSGMEQFDELIRMGLAVVKHGGRDEQSSGGRGNNGRQPHGAGQNRRQTPRAD